MCSRAVTAVLVVLACCGAVPSVSARRLPRDLTSLPDGIPITALFAACGQSSQGNDIGPCLKELLTTTIDLAKPQFSTGILIKGKNKVLEPLSLKDVPAKSKRKLQFSLKNLQVHGLSTVSVDDVRLEPTRLALELSFEHLRATSDITLRYSFIRGDSNVDITLQRPRLRLEAGWQLSVVDDKLGITLSEPEVDISISGLSTRITKLGGLGGFLQTILNNNSGVLLQFLVPELERQAQQQLEEQLETIQLA